MVNVVINERNEDTETCQGDFGLIMTITDLEKDCSRASTQAITQGLFHPLYLYYIGYQLVDIINSISKFEGSPSLEDLFDLLGGEGLKDGVDCLVLNDTENEDQEADHVRSNN